MIFIKTLIELIFCQIDIPSLAMDYWFQDIVRSGNDSFSLFCLYKTTMDMEWNKCDLSVDFQI